MTKNGILEMVANGDLTVEQASEELAKVEEALFGESIKTTDKGGVSIRMPGQRYPVTLYPKDWIYVLERSGRWTGTIYYV